MLAGSFGWGICVIVISLIGLYLCFRHHVGLALALTVPLSFVAPVWLKIHVAGVPFTVQTAIAAIFLLIFTVRVPWEIRSPIVLLDLVVAAFVVLQCCSDSYHGQSALQSGLIGYGEWALPYVAGRFALRNQGHMDAVAWCIAGVVLVLGIGGAIECVTRVNPWELVFGDRPVDGAARLMTRKAFGMELKRSFGPTMHPIFFGLLVMVLAPWPIALWRWSRTSSQRGGAIAAIVGGITGVFSSLSRGPALALLGFFGFYTMIWWKVTRWILCVLAIAGAGWLFYDWNGILVAFEELGGEKSYKTNIVLDGEKLELSSVRHRAVLWQLYWPAMREAGVLGYGTVALSDLPPKVPYLPKKESHREALRFVDNGFLMLGLRFGWTGMGLYGLLLIVATVTGFRMFSDRSIGVITSGLASMTIAIGFATLTVWFVYDMAFESLWSFGVLAGLASQRR